MSRFQAIRSKFERRRYLCTPRTSWSNVMQSLDFQQPKRTRIERMSFWTPLILWSKFLVRKTSEPCVSLLPIVSRWRAQLPNVQRSASRRQMVDGFGTFTLHRHYHQTNWNNFVPGNCKTTHFLKQNHWIDQAFMSAKRFRSSLMCCLRAALLNNVFFASSSSSTTANRRSDVCM